MSHESAERRRPEDPARPHEPAEGEAVGGGADGDRSVGVDAAHAGGGSAVEGDAARAAAADGARTGARPLSRRELRERGRAAGPDDPPALDPRVAADPTPGPTAPAARPATPAPGSPSAPPPPPRSLETVPSDTSRYAVPHYVALALVACVLGYLLWSLATGAAEPGATDAGPVVSTTSPSAPPTATQGEL